MCYESSMGRGLAYGYFAYFCPGYYSPPATAYFRTGEGRDADNHLGICTRNVWLPLAKAANCSSVCCRHISWWSPTWMSRTCNRRCGGSMEWGAILQLNFAYRRSDGLTP